MVRYAQNLNVVPSANPTPFAEMLSASALSKPSR